MADFGIGVASNVTGAIIGVVIQQMKDIIEMEKNVRDLNTDFTRMEVFLRTIETQFEEQQRAIPEPVCNCLERMHNALGVAHNLILRAEPQPRCLGCCRLRNPNLSTQIRDWKTGFDRLFQELEMVFSTCANALQLVSSAAPRPEVLLQPVADSGFVGSVIQSHQMQLQAWLTQPHRQARMIGVYGMGGIGKTSLLKLVYNHYKEVSGVFDVIIWLTVSQQYQIEKLQASIAETLNLKLDESSDKDIRKMKLSASLGMKKFLLVLDDIWHPIDLIDEIGVKFGDHNCSKVLMSSRSRDVILEMEASDDYSLRIQPLSTEEGWELFRTQAFTNGALPRDQNIEAIARNIASECQGLPLALNVVAAAMRRKKTEDEWRRALTLMRYVDPSFRTTHSTIDADLYQRLRWSYNDLPDRNLKICFLYCAVFPEDAVIPAERLVEMWNAEKLVTQMDAGYDYIDALVGRDLFEYVADDPRETIRVLAGRLYGNQIRGKAVKVHDVLRDLAMYIGRSEDNWFFATGHHLQDFPSEDEIRDCKRISVGHNDIQDLPTDLICSNLVSLVLANNEKITEVPQRFLSTAMSLKVLDLSQCTFITSLPTSLGQLRQLEFLKLTGCVRLENLPESTGNLSDLRFLYLDFCQSLLSLPDSIRKLRNLRHLRLEGCNSLMVIPHGISHLTLLNKLSLPESDYRRPISVEVLANLSNLKELSATLKSEIKEGTVTRWTDMRDLTLSFDADKDDVVNDVFPLSMENLNRLEYLHLHNCKWVSLPKCISQFQNLRTLYLHSDWVHSDCTQLRELPAGGGFPRLKILKIVNINKLESMVGSSVVSSEETMPKLEEIELEFCSSLKRLGKKKLPTLKELTINGCGEFETLEIESGGLPMLEILSLLQLEKFQIGVVNDGVMPKLQYLNIFCCPLLKRLGIDKLPNLRDVHISSCGLTELEIGNGGFSMLDRLLLDYCENLENMVGPPDAWSDKTMPNLRVLRIRKCPLLRRLPIGIENLSNLKHIVGELEWWQKLVWADDNVKVTLSQIFTTDDNID